MATRRRVLAKKLRLNADAWRFEEGHALVNSDDKREREARGERWFWYSLACVVESYQGDFGELERALGMHMIGPLVGWRVLALIHNRKTLRKYESILGLTSVRDAYPEEGPYAYKSQGLAIAKKLGEFWKAVDGAIVPVDKRRQMS